MTDDNTCVYYLSEGKVGTHRLTYDGRKVEFVWLKDHGGITRYSIDANSVEEFKKALTVFEVLDRMNKKNFKRG